MARERFLPGTLVGDRFEIERLAGAGGMGDVYRALDRRTGAAVALKFLRQVGKGYVTRFEREARALAQLTHPGIVRYVAHGREPAFFLAMEWLEGEDLARRLARGPLSVGQTLIVARGIADALSAAHARGIVHRDIKPSNVFLCGGRLEEVKLLDFGVAQLDKSTLALTGTGQLIGTLGYMAPEQAMSGRDMTPAADVFSLGCVLFECVAGRGPFAGSSPRSSCPSPRACASSGATRRTRSTSCSRGCCARIRRPAPPSPPSRPTSRASSRRGRPPTWRWPRARVTSPR